MNTAARLVLGLILPLVITGCASSKPKPVAWNIEITKRTTTTIEVDLVGVSTADKPYWMNGVKPDDYWKPGSSVRKNAQKLSNDFQSGPQWVLGKDDPAWMTWRSFGATDLMIMANLPGRQFDNGPFDRRRVFLPLDKKAYDLKDKTIRVEVLDDFIRVLTPPKPKE